jgi:hypothetical protein
MSKTMTAFVAALALLVAACGDDDSDGTDDDARGGEQTSDDVPAGEAGDIGEFCDDFVSIASPEEASAVVPPAEIADVWEAATTSEAGDPEAGMEILTFVAEHCENAGDIGEMPPTDGEDQG